MYSHNLTATPNYKNLFKPKLDKFCMVKFPKTTNRFCSKCKKKTDHKIKLVGTGNKRGTLTRGSKSRARLRGQNRGIGNQGKYSKPAVSKFKRKTKTTKKTNVLYTCSVCKHAHYRKSRRNQRAGKQLQE
jgi:ribosomal protein L44E